jgi:ribonuclease HII
VSDQAGKAGFLYNEYMTKIVPPTLDLETFFWNQGIPSVAGVDEAGRGAWAGPVAAGAVILPPGTEILKQLEGVQDSKKMTVNQREHWFTVIQQHCLGWGIGYASNAEIDAFGILPATKLAMRRAVAQCIPAAAALVIDAVKLPEVALPQLSINFGDSLSLSIAAASVLAKVSRDRWMIAAAERFPEYGFASHKGYGTRQHSAALAHKGACEIHRFTYQPIRLNG